MRNATLFILLFLSASQVFAQTSINITGASSGFPIAIAELCNAGDADGPNKEIPEIITRNLNFAGLFKILDPGSFIENASACVPADQTAFSDWSVIGAEGLVKGQVRSLGGDTYEVQLYLLDVQQKKAMLGKRYEFKMKDLRRVSHRFSNEIMKFFTGQLGIFGTRIAYVSKVGRFKELFMMDADGSSPYQITKDRGLAISPSWSPSGDRLIYTSYRGRKPDLYFLSPEGGEPERLTNRDGLELGAKFARDGQSVISSASFENGESAIVRFDLRGKLLGRLTNSGSIDVSPSLSPDGSEIAFCSGRSGGPQIYTMPSSGGQAKRISFTESSYCTSPAWSPTENKIAFVCRTGGFQIYILDQTKGQPEQITFVGNNEDPAWSPDGKYLAFSSNLGRGYNKNIVIYSVVAGSTTQVSKEGADATQPTWSPRVD